MYKKVRQKRKKIYQVQVQEIKMTEDCLNELVTNYRGRRLPGKEVSGKQSSLFI